MTQDEIKCPCLLFLRHLSDNVVHIIIILFTYFIESAHVNAILICWSILFVMVVGPMPFHVAQLVNVLVWVSADVATTLGCSISLFKVLFVTHFDTMFNQNPEDLARTVLGICLLIVLIPHGLFYIYQSVNGTRVTPVVSYYMGEPMVAEIFGLTCLLMCVIMLVFAMLFIPCYVKRQTKLPILAAEEVKTIGLARVLSCGCGMIVALTIALAGQANGLARDFPVQSLLVAVTTCFILICYILDANIIIFVKQKINLQLQSLTFYKSNLLFRWRKRKIYPLHT